MAKRKVAQKLRSAAVSADTRSQNPAERASALLAALQQERSRLMKAESLLGCALLAMDYDECVASEVYYPDVIEQALELIKKAIERLDSVNIRPMIETLKQQDKDAYPDGQENLRCGAKHQIRDSGSWPMPSYGSLH